MKQGTYTFNVYHFGRLFQHKVTVKIVAENEKTYTIICPCAIGSHQPGDTMRVRKSSVRLPFSNSQPQPPAQHDYSNAWWNQ